MSAETTLNALLAECVGKSASDLHLAVGEVPCLRIEGPLVRRPEQEAWTAAQVEDVARFLAPDLDAQLEKNGSYDGAHTAPDGTRFRVNVYRRDRGLALALRRLESRFRTLGELGLDDALYQLCDLPYGLVVVSGPTGSGKSTTIATLIDRINRSYPHHVITIEDPIEYLHSSQRALVNQRQVGRDAPSFNEALVASLRQDPDVVMVGEIRDLDTIRTAITASETGHLVFTTVHAGDCVGTIERLVGVFPAGEQDGIRQQLALVLRAVVSQRLLIAEDGPETARGADALRVVASETLMVTPAVSSLIASGKSPQIFAAMESGARYGMRTMDQDLARLVTERRISERVAAAVARRPDTMRARAAQMRMEAVR